MSFLTEDLIRFDTISVLFSELRSSSNVAVTSNSFVLELTPKQLKEIITKYSKSGNGIAGGFKRQENNGIFKLYIDPYSTTCSCDRMCETKMTKKTTSMTPRFKGPPYLELCR